MLPGGDRGDPRGASRVGGDLGLRVASAAVLAPLALAAAYFGGWPFLVFWAIAALGTWWEWLGLVTARAGGRVLASGSITLLAAAGLLAGAHPVAAIAIALAGAATTAVLAYANRAWIGAGVIYAGVLVIASVLLRGDATFGLAAIVLLFAVVWTTDIVAYFAGRLIGGPKLWPRVSPKKTWSGALAGAAGSVVAGLVVARIAGVGNPGAIVVLCLALSAASQAGDLFESALKRRFGVKDAGKLIPGHGGMMDRLDGYVAAALFALTVGVFRGGTSTPSQGLLIW
jgi:phosphatidate cytidylyltransferase